MHLFNNKTYIPALALAAGNEAQLAPVACASRHFHGREHRDSSTPADGGVIMPSARARREEDRKKVRAVL